MGLSRLENFIRSVRGNIIYVDPNALDSTDSIENTGTSLARPFKTLQRALVEAARFSYLPGQDNDKFGNTSILLYPGDHLIDNRPGLIPNGSNFLFRNGTPTVDFEPFDLRSNFDLTTDNNELYKLNSVSGGVIVPRGTSIVGIDLRKTKIRPKYIPDPTDDTIDRSAIFKLTGACYLWQFSIFDADPNGQCFYNYTNLKKVPNFSHNKLTAFEYADGINNVEFEGIGSFTRTDLEMYYEKISIAYGVSSGRRIEPTYPSEIDIQPKIDEYRIVGSKGAQIGITSITSNGNKITVTLNGDFPDVQVDTPIRIDGVLTNGYNGQYVVSSVIEANKIQYNVSTPPLITNGGSGGTLTVVVDTVTSASPYIFNISLRSVYGMCGLHADGSKADGFKSIVVAQFTGISLQKDNNAFVVYNPITGLYEDTTTSPDSNLYSNSKSRFKEGYSNYHVKASNDAIIQAVSVFAIGYAEHFLAESGGDQSITNSNSNFGARSLSAKGFRFDAFPRDDVGYISHIIPPQIIGSQETTISPFIEFSALDVTQTVAIGLADRLYLYNQTNQQLKPDTVIDGYRIGAKPNDTLNVLINGIETSTAIKMQGTSPSNFQKSYIVNKKLGGVGNDISSNIITFTQNHDFINGESVRILSSDGSLPSGIEPNTIYYAITDASLFTLGPNQIKLAKTFNDAQNGASVNSPIDIYSIETGNLKVVSRVTDKISGDPGHPIQWDDVTEQWYINVISPSAIYDAFSTYPFEVTPRTYIKRTIDIRSLDDKIFKLRYVIPKDSKTKARPPLDGFIIQESSSNIPQDSELQSQFGIDVSFLDRTDSLKNTRIISGATNTAGVVRIKSEIPHNLSVGSKVKIQQVASTDNPSALYNFGYNGLYTVTAIDSSLQFTCSNTKNPGTFLNNTSIRNSSLPYFTRKHYNDTYVTYRSQEIQPYIRGVQDGVYHIIPINTSNSPRPAEFSNLRFSQPIKNLYPQENRDNPQSDPKSTISYAVPDPIGQVIIDDPQNSLTKETVEKFINDHRVGFAVTDIRSTSSTTHTIFTAVDHGLQGITGLTIVNPGTAYGSGSGTEEDLYNATLIGGSGQNATALIRVDAVGQIQSIKIINPGSSYTVGNTLTVTGVATTLGHVAGTVQVTSINNQTLSLISVDGIKNDDLQKYNNLYRISSVPSAKSITVISSNEISPFSSAGISTSAITSKIIANLGPLVLFSNTLKHDPDTNFGVITGGSAHGLKVNSKVRISGATNPVYNQDFIVTKINSLTSFNVNLGFTTTTTTLATPIFIYSHLYSSNLGSISRENEKLTSRLIPYYGGISATISAPVSEIDTAITITGAETSGLKIGDFITIDNETLKISATIDSNTISVFRGALGSVIEPHLLNAAVRKINPIPIEFRRHSILRASGHTFEYVGFGPGNYSTALPESQDRIISPQEEFLSQSFKSDGGINVFTAMNNDGDFYIGNKKISSSTGQEEVYDSPIPTVTGEDNISDRSDVISPLDINVTNSIKVEGGINKQNLSKFDGPVVFNNKITSTSEKGIEADSIFLQGSAEVSRKFSVAPDAPILIGNSGDVIFNTTPDDGGSAGWMFTNQNAWREFGPVKDSNGRYVGIWSGTFYGTVVGGGPAAPVSPWVITPVGIYTGGNVGIGTEAVTNVALNVNGTMNLNGIMRVTEVIEKATIENSAWPPLVGDPLININIGDNNVYYYTSPCSGNWILNFTGNPSLVLSNFLNVGESITVAFLATQGPTAFYNNQIRIDNVDVTSSVRYYGGGAYTSGFENGIDVYTFIIIRKQLTGTPSEQYTILASQSNYGA